jgi:hypothetical protein
MDSRCDGMYFWLIKELPVSPPTEIFSASFVFLLLQLWSILNLWGVMLFLRIAWMNAQAGMGMLYLKEKFFFNFQQIQIQIFKKKNRLVEFRFGFQDCFWLSFLWVRPLPF